MHRHTSKIIFFGFFSAKDQVFHTPSFLKTPCDDKFANEVELAPTPMPDYEQMLSPLLRQELRRFGLKVIPKTKAVPLLKHIFDETHPKVRRKVNFIVEEEEEDEMTPLSQESNNSDFPEETIVTEDIVDELHRNDDLSSRLVTFIQDDADLHRQTLMYEPLWLEDLFQRFKEETGLSVKLNQVQDVLDNECITFRTRARHDKNQKRNVKKS